MDAGPVYAQAEVRVHDDENATQLYGRLFAIGTELLHEQLQYGLSEPVSQVGEVTFCGKFTAEDFHIDWNSSADHIVRLTRIGKPWTTFRGKRIGIIHARVAAGKQLQPSEIDGTTVGTANGVIELLQVQPESKPVQDADAWLRGARLVSGESFR
jgi:methionyl-tRNA formyltransferase